MQKKAQNSKKGDRSIKSVLTYAVLNEDNTKTVCLRIKLYKPNFLTIGKTIDLKISKYENTFNFAHTL